MGRQAAVAAAESRKLKEIQSSNRSKKGDTNVKSELNASLSIKGKASASKAEPEDDIRQTKLSL
jgi:hypothetical protein